jgi:hypothetical protein
MSFTGNENHNISLTDASALTANFRTGKPANTILGFFYGKQAIQNILNQEDCVGIRIYYAQESNGSPKMVIVGVKANQDDIHNGLIAEFGNPCPNMCGNLNALNS